MSNSKPSFKKKKSEPQQYWSGLPKDILRLILEKLPWSERLRLSLVRKTWKECFHEIKNTQEFLPWLMFYNWDKCRGCRDENHGNSICKLADPFVQKRFTVEEATKGTEREFFFLCRTLCFKSWFPGLEIGFSDMASFYLNPASSDCTVIAFSILVAGKLEIGTCHPGDESWKKFEFCGDYDFICDVGYADESFYCSLSNGKLGAFNIKQQEWKLLWNLQSELSPLVYLYAFNGDLIMGLGDCNPRSLPCALWRFDLLERKWVVVENEIIEKKDSASHLHMDEAIWEELHNLLEGYVKKLLGDGLVMTEGEKWFKLRKLANNAFHGESLKGMIPAMIASAEMMLERWRQHDGKEIEVFQEFRILTSEVISRTAFGSSYLEGQNIFDMLVKMAVLISRNGYKIRIPLIGTLAKTSDDLESEKLEQGIRDSFVKMIKKREEKVEMGKLDSYGNDFFGSLLQAYHETDKTKKITIDDMIDECKTFYIGGHETTTSLLTWTILLLAINADWQEKLRKEVLELFGKQNPKPDSIGRLKTMSMVVNETLRLYPPFVQIMRRINREVRLGKLTLPVNMEAFIPTIAVHHNPDIWGEDAHLFKPERFSQGVAKATNNNTAAFLPFGLGPRSCVGLNFAITEAKVALSMILQRYKFNLSPNYVHSPTQFLTICPQHGLQIMLHSL
ncbi:hypothetical protein EZV62_017984 [Acer yangbiense]|uniref:F-box domain-containing protein n=1 Tax=Acer yangbiense TaxID=1000413 RepID=A0A5C7HI36_9ROSI|nr:hypothetical protein EZV62_017984 [Acer yangbiense]